MSFIGKIFGSKSNNPNEAFWKWFSANSVELLKVTDCTESICSQLERQMKMVHKGLVFAFGPTVDDRREFIVSADGIKAMFPAVLSLVNSAPDISGWRIIAFRPAVGWTMEFRMDGATVGARDIWYTAEVNGGTVDLTLYVNKQMLERDPKTITHIAYLLLDYGLGEYIVETRIGRIDLQPLPDETLPSDLKPLPELSNVVNKLIG